MVFVSSAEGTRVSGKRQEVKEWAYRRQLARMVGERVLEKGPKAVGLEGRGIAWGGSALSRRDTKRCRGDSWGTVGMGGEEGPRGNI